MKSNKKFLSVALAALLVGGVVVGAGCNNTSNNDLGNNGDNVTVWTTDAQEKVLQTTKDYEIPALKPLSIEMAKGELEGAQIMMRANTDISDYNVTVSRLKNGKAYISEEQINVYAEKYVGISEKLNKNDQYPVGSFVPDALLPMETSAEYEENKIVKGNNQGVYVEVETSADTPSGTYTGTATVTADKQTYTVPVSVTVWDFEIPQTPSTRNYLSRFSRDHFSSFELDGTDEMDTIYFEKMLEYRMNSYLPFCGIGGIPRYIELLRKYYNWKGFSNYNVYYEVTTQMYNGEKSPFNVTLLKQYLKAIVEASLEDNINYLDKAMFYFCNIIDEPSENRPGSFQNVQMVDKIYNMMLADLSAELTKELVHNENYAYYLEIVRPTLEKIPNVLPINEQLKGTLENTYNVENITYCVEVEHFDSQEKRDAFQQDGSGRQVWFYTCIYPLYPYPSTHIDDSLLGSRLMSWIQKAYDFDGYLNWAVNDYLENNYTNPVNDPYAEDLRGAYVPGDGFLFYPGAKYGISGPVGSLRAVSYRDGMEDYEYLTLLEEVYEARDIDSSAIENNLYQKLFNEVTPTTDRDVFYAQRRELAKMITDCTSDFGILYDTLEIRQGKAKVVFNTYNSAATVVYKGETLTKNSDGVYELSVDLTKETTLTLSVCYNGKTQTVERYLSGLYKGLEGFETGNKGFIATYEESICTVNTDINYVSEGAKSLKVELYGKDSGAQTYEPFFAIRTKDICGGDLSKIDRLTLTVYNAEDTTTVFRLKTFVGSQYVTIATYTLQPGWNYLQVGVANLSNVQNIKGFYFFTDNILDEESMPASKTFYLDEFAYTEK